MQLIQSNYSSFIDNLKVLLKPKLLETEELR